MIVNELRRMCGHDSRSVDGCTTCEAADEIERLRRDGFDPRHPVAQNLIGRNARLSIALDIVRDILADDCEPTPITAEHWEPIHDQVQSVVRERDELRAEVERLRAALEVTPAPVTLEAAEWAIGVFRAEEEQLRADAARYRWLRDVADYMMPPTPGVIRLDIDDRIEHLSGDALDAAIDAAMGGEKRE